MNIHEFMRLPHRFRWGGLGGDDCMTFAASWAEEVTGTDPAAALRGTYRTREEAEAIIARFGGPEEFMDQHLCAISATRLAATERVKDGDIGLVRVTTADTDGRPYVASVGAVAFGPLWLSIGPGGVVGRKAEMLMAWRLPE